MSIVPTQATKFSVRCTVMGPVASVRLARPAVHNALNAASIHELTQAFEQMPEAVRLVVLEGLGKSFCAGADVTDMQRSISHTAAQNRADAQALSAMFAAVQRAPQVVIAKVHGAALGGGAGLVSCCDLVVCTKDSRFGFTEARLGLAPAVIAPHVVRRIGAAHARRLFLTAEIFEAAQAQAVGLVDVVADGEALAQQLHSWQTAVLGNGPKALARIKALLQRISALDAHAAAELGVETISALRVSDEGQAGLLAFLHKTKPPWILP